jgi:SAM-dependent methyltransferase
MATDPRFAAPDPREVDPRAVRRAFARAAATYDAAAALQREVSARMAQRLDYVRLTPQRVLDAGCGTGEAVGELAARYADARVIGLDIAHPMVAAARERAASGRSMLRRLLRPVLHGPGGGLPSFVCACRTTSCGATSRSSGSTTCRARSARSGGCSRWAGCSCSAPSARIR